MSFPTAFDRQFDEWRRDRDERDAYLDEMEAREEERHAAQLTFTTGTQLAALKIPEREPLMKEGCNVLFQKSSVNQILAWRGVGKTAFALGLAGALTSGGKILGFQATRATRVMYVDGELPAAQLQERVNDLVTNPENFAVINGELLKHKASINLLQDSTWGTLLDCVDSFKPDVLILDSRSTLFPSAVANDEEHQGYIQAKMLELRLKGLCVVELHHVGKNRQQRGHSRNDDVLDVQMHLKEAPGWEPGQGLKFVMGWEKVRHQARFESGYTVTLAGSTWHHADTLSADVFELLNKGKTVRQIAEELGVDRNKVARTKKKLEANPAAVWSEKKRARDRKDEA